MNGKLTAAEGKLKEVAGEFNEEKLVEQWEDQKETTKAEGKESKGRRAVYKKLINLVKARDQVVSKMLVQSIMTPIIGNSW